MPDLYELEKQPVDIYATEKPDMYAVEAEKPSVVADMAKQVPYGAARGAVETLEAIQDFFINEPAKVLESYFPLGGFKWGDDGPKYVPDATGIIESQQKNTADIQAAIPKAETLPGSLVGGISQFAAPMSAYSKILKGVTALPQATRLYGAGALADMTAFDPQGPRLSNLIENAGISTPVTRALQANSEDPSYIGRAKSAVEGGLAAGLLDLGMRGIKTFKGKPSTPTDIPAPSIPKAVPEERLIVTDTSIPKAIRAKAGIVEPEVPVVRPAKEGFAANLNLEKMDTVEQVKAELKHVAGTNKDFATQRRGIRSHAVTKKSSEVQDLETLLGRKVGVAYNAEEALKLRQATINSGEGLVTLAKKALGGSDTDLLAFQKHLTRHVAIQEQLAGATSEAGRALNQFKITVKGDKAKQDAIQAIIETSGGREKIEATAKILSELTDETAINKFAEKAYRASISDMALETWINFLLSGPQTHAVNAISNTLTSLWTLPENLIASGIGKLHKGEKVLARDVAARAVGIGHGLTKGIQRGIKTFASGEPSDVLSKIETSKYKAVPGPVGSVIRTPGRALMAEDEFFKSVGYSMELYSRAARQATTEGFRGRELAKKIQEYVSNPTEAMDQAGKDYARYVTFTKPLGTAGKHIQNFVSSHPAFRFVAPFIRTPTNIIKFAGERTPLSLFSKEVRAVLKGRDGKIARDLQLARLGMGTAISTAVYNMAAEGTITGGGPTDPKQRGALYLTGWQPYSVKIDDSYYAYSRLEPLGILLGYAADAANIAEKTNKAEADEIGALVLASVTKNLTSKTWLKGLSDLVSAIEDPERYGDKWVQSYAGTVIPTGVAQYARVKDPILRQTDTVLEKVKSRIPGVSKSLLPRRNFYGEPIKLEGGVGPDIISPVYINHKKNDKLAEELVRLEYYPSLPRKKIGSVDLTPDQYDELAEKSGKVTKKILNSFIQSPKYANLPDQAKVDAVKMIIEKVRSNARKELQIKYPEITHEIASAKAKKYSD